MVLHEPFIITARLMAGVRVGGGFISIGPGPRNSEGRTRYAVFIDLPDGTEHEVTDLKSGCGGGDLVEGMVSLLCFLGAAAGSYRYRGCKYTGDPDDNSSLFPQPVTEWAYQNSDEIDMLRIEIEESKTTLIED
jgi:hypothetical protein